MFSILITDLPCDAWEQGRRFVAVFGSGSCLEGGAIGALGNGGIGLVSDHLDLVQGAVVFFAAMVGALRDGASDGMVGSGAGAAPAGILVIVHFVTDPFFFFFADLFLCLRTVIVAYRATVYSLRAEKFVCGNIAILTKM